MLRRFVNTHASFFPVAASFPSPPVTYLLDTTLPLASTGGCVPTQTMEGGWGSRHPQSANSANLLVMRVRAATRLPQDIRSAYFTSLIFQS
jgi:hypothetical protein